MAACLKNAKVTRPTCMNYPRHRAIRHAFGTTGRYSQLALE